MDTDLPSEHLLKEKAQSLLSEVESGEVSDAVQALMQLSDARNDSLFNQIGKITRGLHDAITNLEISEASRLDGKDVQTRLGYVLDLTQDAATKTMDLADSASPIASELRIESEQLRKDWSRLGNEELTAGECRDLYRRIDDFLADSEEKSHRLHATLTDIVVAQGYQDLSGQVLQQIVSMLQKTESDLVKLLSLASQMQAVSGTESSRGASAPASPPKTDVAAEGPLPMSAATLNDQAEVDELLSSLGF